MAFLGGARASHGRWIQPAYSSYGPNADPYVRYPRHRVGALTDSPRAYVEGTDAIVEALDIPIMQQALDLQKGVFAIADELGLGDEVRGAVYALRAAAYATVPFGGPAVAVSAGVAAAGVSGLGLGAIAGLGALGVVAVVLFGLFSGDDDADAQKRIKIAQAAVLHLRDRLTLKQFAAEQEGVASNEKMFAQAAAVLPAKYGTASEHLAASARASKLAQFYREADKRLPSGERALFETVSNLGRWKAVLAEYQGLSQKEKDGLDVMFGKSAPRLPSQLQQPIAAEAAKLPSLVAGAKPARMSGSEAGLGTAVLLAGAGGLLYYFAPVATLGALGMIWAGTKRAGSYVYGKAKGAVT